MPWIRGLHRLAVVVLALTLALAAAGSPGVGDAAGTLPPWLTFHHDNARDGVDATSPPFASVSPGWQSANLDGQIYAEPLLYGSTILVATENNTVYALNASNGSVVWQNHLAPPVPAASAACSNIDPIGITGTPVVDPTTGVLYAVGFTPPGVFILFALKAGTGALLGALPIILPGVDQTLHLQRPALALANGNVYMAFGGKDCGTYHGYVVAVPTTMTGTPTVFQVPTTTGGSIWAPSGPSIDAAGNLYVATGNGDSDTFRLADSVIKLSPSLTVLDYFAPTNWAILGEQDIDLGSVGPALLPNGLIFDIGKEGVGYLLDSQALGGIGGQRFAAQVCLPGGRPFAGVAVVPPLIYVPCSNGIVALQLGAGPSFSVLWRGPSMFKPGPPIYAGGAVWTASTRGVLYALDAVTGQVRFAAATQDPATSFPSLAAANGTIYAATGTQIVTYTMSPNAGAPFGGRNLRLGAGSPGNAALSWLGGTAQTGYVLLPQPGTPVLLPASATTTSSPLPSTSQFDCFQLLATSATPAFALSDALCAYPGDQSGAAAPGFGVELDQTNTATLTWTAPGGQDGYLVLAENEAGGTPHLRVLSTPANATSITDDTGGQLTCYMLVTLTANAATGNTDLYCAAPGASLMPSGAAISTARASRPSTAAVAAAGMGRDTQFVSSVATELQHGTYRQVIKQALQTIHQTHGGRP